MQSEHNLTSEDLRSLLTSDEADPIRREHDWAICGLVTNFVSAKSSKRFYGFADGIDYYEFSRWGPGVMMIKGLMHWTDEDHGWIEPFVVKLRLVESPRKGVGYDIRFGADEEPTVKYGDSGHRKMRDMICSATFEELLRRYDWAFEYRGVEEVDDA